jgi:hypothetical protein
VLPIAAALGSFLVRNILTLRRQSPYPRLLLPPRWPSAVHSNLPSAPLTST